MENLYYILEAKYVDWAWVLNKYIASLKLGPSDAFLSIEHEYPIFYLRRSKVDVEALAKVLGADPKMLAKATRVSLDMLGDQDKWQKPTVPYIGEA